MKNVLNYQTSEYDCDRISFLNGVRYLFDREEDFPGYCKIYYALIRWTRIIRRESCVGAAPRPAAMHYSHDWMTTLQRRAAFRSTANFSPVMR